MSKTRYLEAAAAIGPPIYVVRGLRPVRFSGFGTSDDVVTSLKLTCGEGLWTVSIGVRVDHPNIASWPVLTTMPYGANRTFPLTFERVPLAIEVDGEPAEFPIVSCGQHWAGEARVADRWVSLCSCSVPISGISLLSKDIEEIRR